MLSVKGMETECLGVGTWRFLLCIFFSVHGWTNYRIEAFHLSMQYNYVMSPRQAEQLV